MRQIRKRSPHGQDEAENLDYAMLPSNSNARPDPACEGRTEAQQAAM